MWENKNDTTNSARRRALFAPSLAEEGRSWMWRLNTKIGFIPLVLRNSKSKLHINNNVTLQNLIEHPFIKANADINLAHVATVLETLWGLFHSHIPLKHGNDLTLCKTKADAKSPLLQFLVLSNQVIENHFIFSSKFIPNRYTDERTILRQGSFNGQTRDLDFASSSIGTNPQAILLLGNNGYDEKTTSNRSWASILRFTLLEQIVAKAYPFPLIPFIYLSFKPHAPMAPFCRNSPSFYFIHAQTQTTRFLIYWSKRMHSHPSSFTRKYVPSVTEHSIVLLLFDIIVYSIHSSISYIVCLHLQSQLSTILLNMLFLSIVFILFYSYHS